MANHKQIIYTHAMKTIENFKKISLIFFIITGIVHLGTSILIANELFLKNSTILNKTMDIPFVITGTIYALSSFRLSLTDPEKDHKILDIILIAFTGLLMIGLIAINLLLPDLNT